MIKQASLRVNGEQVFHSEQTIGIPWIISGNKLLSEEQLLSNMAFTMIICEHETSQDETPCQAHSLLLDLATVGKMLQIMMINRLTPISAAVAHETNANRGRLSTGSL